MAEAGGSWRGGDTGADERGGYTSKENETPRSIAKHLGVDVKELMAVYFFFILFFHFFFCCQTLGCWCQGFHAGFALFLCLSLFLSLPLSVSFLFHSLPFSVPFLPYGLPRSLTLFLSPPNFSSPSPSPSFSLSRFDHVWVKADFVSRNVRCLSLFAGQFCKIWPHVRQLALQGGLFMSSSDAKLWLQPIFELCEITRNGAICTPTRASRGSVYEFCYRYKEDNVYFCKQHLHQRQTAPQEY